MFRFRLDRRRSQFDAEQTVDLLGGGRSCMQRRDGSRRSVWYAVGQAKRRTMTFNTSRDTISLCYLPQLYGSRAPSQNFINCRGKHPNVASRHHMALLRISDQLSSGRKAVGRNDRTVERHGFQHDCAWSRRSYGSVHHVPGDVRGLDLQLVRQPPAAMDADVNRFSPSRSDRNRVASRPRTLFPAASRRGENVARAPLPGATVMMSPLTPLLPGRPTS